MDSDDYEYSDGSSMEYASDVDDDYDDATEQIQTTRKPYVVLPKADLLVRQQETIAKTTSILGISDEDAARVLRKFKWDASRVNDEWFSDTDGIRAAVGLIDAQARPTQGEGKCMICFEEFPLSGMSSAGCPHYFCATCWRGYLTNAVQNGLPCLDLRCPIPDCKAAVPEALFEGQLPPGEVAKYHEYQLRSFVEESRGMAWCTGPACEAAVEVRVERTPDDPLDVLCSECGTTFCFNCKEEAHRPVACATVRKWVTKNSAESENLNWILANTKPCPKCHRPIEKNQGCMHMTCSQCRHEFCWLCNGSWAEHGERTGGFYACNRYETAKKAGSYDDETRRRENAKHSLERYMHYFERFDAHNKAREKAKQDRARTAEVTLEALSDMTKTPTSQLKFIMDAWGQVVECRRMLKWTYAYGYYAFEEEGDPQVEQHRTFFEFLQGDAERSLEKLHELAEKELRALQGEHEERGLIPPEAFQDFRKRLTGLTDVTKQFFDKLVQQLELGFDEMNTMYAAELLRMNSDGHSSGSGSQGGAGGSGGGAAGPSGSGAGPSSSNPRGGGGASSSGAGGSGSGSGAAGSKRSRLAGGSSGKGGGRGGEGGEDVVTGAGGEAYWVCRHCTIHNSDLNATDCEVCRLPREA